MRLEKLKIKNYRSIENIEIDFPDWKPIVLIGPNNVWKSNILKAIDCLLWDRYAPYIEFQDSDFFLRDKKEYPNISISAYFDWDIKRTSPTSKSLHFTTNYEYVDNARNTLKGNIFHNSSWNSMYLKTEDKEQCSFVLIDANRDINRQLSYFNQYSILSKMAKKLHTVMKEKVKAELDKNFKHLKDTFETVPEYKSFHEKLQKSFQNNIDGFEHKLEIDLSAYDPNNYFHSLRITAKDSETNRSFEEFWTWEQQILLMSFVKAYAETFKSENFILWIEEPEAHLHPIAQRWLAKNIANMAKSWVQVIITTHSPDFLDIEWLQWFVKVYKEDNITKVIQHNAESLTRHCIEKKAKSSTTPQNILTFYKVKTFYDQMRGFFARKILLVEWETEFFSLPNYFNNCWYDFAKNGLEIINCRGKWQITRNYRLFTAYWYKCFCLFDGDNWKWSNIDFADTFSFEKDKMNQDITSFTFGNDFWYFWKDFETYMRWNIADYETEEESMVTKFEISDKPLKAKIVSEFRQDFCPDFVEEIANKLYLEKEIVNTPESTENEIVAIREEIVSF